MKTKKLTKEELENMSYDDLAYVILKDNGKKMKIQTLFKKECELLNLDEKTFEDKIADFFELLSTDKRFIMLNNGYWDLRSNHSPKVVVIDEDDEEVVVENEEASEEDSEDNFYDSDDENDDGDDDLKELVIIDEEEIDSEL